MSQSARDLLGPDPELEPADAYRLAHGEAYIQRLCWTLTIAALLLVAAGFGLVHLISMHFATSETALCVREIMYGPLCP